MKNQTTGKYEVKRLIKKFNIEIVGQGDTQEEAQVDFKNRLLHFRVYQNQYFQQAKDEEGQPVSIHSPGYSQFKGKNGHVGYRYNPNRTEPVLARMDPNEVFTSSLAAMAAHAERQAQDQAQSETPVQPTVE